MLCKNGLVRDLYAPTHKPLPNRIVSAFNDSTARISFLHYKAIWNYSYDFS